MSCFSSPATGAPVKIEGIMDSTKYSNYGTLPEDFCYIAEDEEKNDHLAR